LKNISVKLQQLSGIYAFLSAAPLLGKDSVVFPIFGKLENRN